MKQKSMSKIALSFIGSHFMGMVISLILIFSLVIITENIILQVLLSLVSILFYWGIIGGPAYKLGNDDLNRVKFKRMDEDLFRGFKIGMLVFIVLAVQMLVMVLAKLGVIPDIFLVYKILNSHLLVFMNLVQNTAFIADVSWINVIIMFSFHLVTPLFIGVSYIMGYKNVTVMDKIIYKNKKPEEDVRKR